MRIEENAFTRTTFKGSTGDEGIEYVIDPNTSRLHLAFNSRSHYSHVFFGGVPELLNFYRDLGEALDLIQPGLVNPLPDGDSSEVDAMKVIYEADQLRKGIK